MLEKEGNRLAMLCPWWARVNIVISVCVWDMHVWVCMCGCECMGVHVGVHVWV